MTPGVGCIGPPSQCSTKNYTPCIWGGVNICQPSCFGFPAILALQGKCCTTTGYCPPGDPIEYDCWFRGTVGGGMKIMYPPPKGKGYHAVTDDPILPTWRYPFIPGTLNTWCTQKCPSKQTVSGKCQEIIDGCPEVCDTRCGDDEWYKIIENLQYTGATGSTFLIDSTQPSNQVSINVKGIAGKNFNNMGTSPVRMVSTNPYGSLYLLNHWRHGTTYNQFIGISGSAIPHKIRYEYIPDGGFGQQPDYLQVAHGQSYGAIINSGGCIQTWERCTFPYDNYFTENPDPNIPWPSDIILWEKSKQNDEILQEGILAGANTVLNSLTGDWTDRPFYISGNKSAAGTVAGMGTTSEGDIFATVWTNPKGYRSFGMNYFRVSEGFDDFGTLTGTTWQANYQDVPKGVFGVRPDLLIWRAAHHLYPSKFFKGFTGCDGFSGQYICRDRQWEGYLGWTGHECNEDRLSPSQVYFKQVSLGNQHGLVSLARLDNIDEANVKYHDNTPNNWSQLRENLNTNRREKIEWLFQFSGSNAANISTGNNWSTENLLIDDIGTLILNPTNPGVVGTPTSAISKLVYTKKDFVYEIGLTAEVQLGPPIEFRVPDVYNDICRWCVTLGKEEEETNPNGDPLIVNPYICNPFLSTGFTGCFRTGVTFGHSDHPIWNSGTAEMPNIFVLSALNIARLIEASTGVLQNASWEWISAGSSGNSCAVLSYNIQGRTNTIQTKRQVLCWGPRYNKPLNDIEEKHWPKNNQQLQPHSTIEPIPCSEPSGVTLGVTWHPCQVDCSLESPIFYQKSWPFASYHIGGNLSMKYPWMTDKEPTTWSYNTLAKVLVWNETATAWISKSNATIDEPMQTHYRDPNFDEDTSKNLSKTIYFPNGLNQVQHRVFNDLPFPDGAEFEDWDNQNTSFLPLIPNFTSSQLQNWGETMFLPEWLNQWWFPNWTPNYPVVSGNSWLVNLYAKNTSINCDQCQFTGNTGCCELQGSQCFISERLDCESVGGTWTDEPCPETCDGACNAIDTNPVTLDFSRTGGSQQVLLSGASKVCNWTAAVSGGDASSWITVDPVAGTASLVNIEVAENNDGSPRFGTVTIRETQSPNTTKTITVNQSDQSGGSDCCVANPGTAGCSDDACETLVCAHDLDCCTIEWDQDCATKAVQLCSACGGGGGSGGGGVGENCCDYFTGPCCKNNSCQENTTPQECHKHDGIFLGFNRTCDDCPS